MTIFLALGDVSGSSVRAALSLDLSYSEASSLSERLSGMGCETIYRRSSGERIPAASECSTGPDRVLALNVAPQVDKATAAALAVAEFLSSSPQTKGPIIIAAAARMPAKLERSGAIVHGPHAALVALGLASAPSDLTLQDPFLASLFHVLTASGFEVSLLLIPGFKPSWRNEAELCFETAVALGALLAKACGRAFSADSCRGLEVAHRWYAESARDDQMYT